MEVTSFVYFDGRKPKHKIIHNKQMLNLAMLQQKLHIRVVPIDDSIMYWRQLEILLVADTFDNNKMMMIIIRLVILINIRAYLFFSQCWAL